MKYSIWNYFIKNLIKVIIHNYLEIGVLLSYNTVTLFKVIGMNYRVLRDLIFYNYRHIKRISKHIYKYNTSESYVKVVQKKVDSAGLHGSKSLKSEKSSRGKSLKV